MEEMKHTLNEWYEREDTQEKLEKLAMRGCCSLLGAFWGTLDVLTSGLPLISGGLPLYELLNVHQAEEYSGLLGPEVTAMDKVKNYATYAAGAAIPFAIYYWKELRDMIS